MEVTPRKILCVKWTPRHDILLREDLTNLKFVFLLEIIRKVPTNLGQDFRQIEAKIVNRPIAIFSLCVIGKVDFTRDRTHLPGQWIFGFNIRSLIASIYARWKEMLICWSDLLKETKRRIFHLIKLSDFIIVLLRKTNLVSVVFSKVYFRLKFWGWVILNLIFCYLPWALTRLPFFISNWTRRFCNLSN